MLLKMIGMACKNILCYRYSVDALLDVVLLKQLASGKLFIGQKLRVINSSVVSNLHSLVQHLSRSSLCLQYNSHL